MIRILCIGLEIADAASYYRICPFFHLEKKLSLEIKIQTSASFVDIMNTDIVFICRGNNEDHLRIAELTKSLGKKLWCDFDDDVSSLQIDHYAFFHYSDPVTKERVQKIAELADQVSVSNDPLLKIYPRSSLIENALDERYFKWRTPSANPMKKIVSWRGSNSHIKTLSIFSDAVVRVMEDHLDWKFHFAGDKPWQIIDQVKKSQPLYLNQWLDTVSWMKYLHELKPTINIVLLHDSPFNRGRSHTSWLENTMAGAVTLAPHWDHWKRQNVVHYSSLGDFERTLHKMLQDPPIEKVESAWKYIQKTFTLKQINKKREDIILKLAA